MNEKLKHEYKVKKTDFIAGQYRVEVDVGGKNYAIFNTTVYNLDKEYRERQMQLLDKEVQEFCDKLNGRHLSWPCIWVIASCFLFTVLLNQCIA